MNKWERGVGSFDKRAVYAVGLVVLGGLLLFGPAEMGGVSRAGELRGGVEAGEVMGVGGEGLLVVGAECGSGDLARQVVPVIDVGKAKIDASQMRLFWREVCSPERAEVNFWLLTTDDGGVGEVRFTWGDGEVVVDLSGLGIDAHWLDIEKFRVRLVKRGSGYDIEGVDIQTHSWTESSREGESVGLPVVLYREEDKGTLHLSPNRCGRRVSVAGVAAEEGWCEEGRKERLSVEDDLNVDLGWEAVFDEASVVELVGEVVPSESGCVSLNEAGVCRVSVRTKW